MHGARGKLEGRHAAGTPSPLGKVFDVPFLSLDGTSVEMASLLFLFLVVIVIANAHRHRQWIRRGVQVVSFVVFFYVVYSCLGVFGMIRNGLYGLTLVGSAYSESFYWLALPFVVIAVTLLHGPVFCGWICPTGSLQDISGWHPQAPAAAAGGSVAAWNWAGILAASLGLHRAAHLARRQEEALRRGFEPALGGDAAPALLPGAGRRDRRHAHPAAASASAWRPSSFHRGLAPGGDLADPLRVHVARRPGVGLDHLGHPGGRAPSCCARGAATSVRGGTSWASCTASRACASRSTRASAIAVACATASCDVGAIEKGVIRVEHCQFCYACVDHCEKRGAVGRRRVGGARRGQAGRHAGGDAAREREPFRMSWRALPVLALLAARPAAADDCELWSQSRCDAQNRAAIDLGDAGDAPPRAWSFDGSGRVWGYEPGLTVWSSPALGVAGGRPLVVAGNYDHTLYCPRRRHGRDRCGGSRPAARCTPRRCSFATAPASCSSPPRTIASSTPSRRPPAARSGCTRSRTSVPPWAALGSPRPAWAAPSDRDDAVFVPYWLWDRSLANSMQRSGVIGPVRRGRASAVASRPGRQRADRGDLRARARPGHALPRLLERQRLCGGRPERRGPVEEDRARLRAQPAGLLARRRRAACSSRAPSSARCAGSTRRPEPSAGSFAPAIASPARPRCSTERRRGCGWLLRPQAARPAGRATVRPLWHDGTRGGVYSSPALIANGAEPMVLFMAWDHMLHATDLEHGQAALRGVHRAAAVERGRHGRQQLGVARGRAHPRSAGWRSWAATTGRCARCLWTRRSAPRPSCAPMCGSGFRFRCSCCPPSAWRCCSPAAIGGGEPPRLLELVDDHGNPTAGHVALEVDAAGTHELGELAVAVQVALRVGGELVRSSPFR